MTRIKLMRFRHPFRTAQALKIRLQAHLGMRRFAGESAKRYTGDPRYHPQNVTDGFASRMDDSSDDTALLERICSAYNRAHEDEQAASPLNRPTEWWHQLRDGPLQPVIRALRAHDLTTLRRMYGNFFRDPCSTGLVPVPWGMARKYFRGPIQGAYCHACLGDALQRIDYWTAQTRGRFELRQLAGPGVGNPFGVFIDGILLAPAAEYHHFCAQSLLSKLGAGRRVVAEIGGGYGGMAYYLLRDGGTLTYLNFDVPESLALMSWYLMKAFPSLRFLLYGEREIGEQFATGADVLLMPPSAMTNVSERSVDVTFSSHAMSDLSRDDLTA